MNIKAMLLPIALAGTSTVLIFYFFGGKNKADRYQFTAPQTAVACLPLDKEINFVDEGRVSTPHIEVVKTAWGELEFSTHGAALTRLVHERKIGSDTQIIGTIFPADDKQKESLAFVIGLQEKTPYAYRMITRREDESMVELVFEGESDSALVRKTFSIHKKIQKLDLSVLLEPKGVGVQARLFYPAPIMPGLKEQNQTAVDIIDGGESFEKRYYDAIKQDAFWVTPLLFGVENKYFIHSLIQDENGFSKRAYYKILGKQQVLAILEGPTIDQRQEWHLSFYIGPKQEKVMRLVEKRLEQTLDYSGIWAPVSRLMLLILNWLFDHVHNYGLAIVILTFLMRLLLLPLSIRADRGMKERAEMQKRLQYLRMKHKDDPQARAQVEFEFMKKSGFGLTGCLPNLVQLPVLLGLSRVLSSSIEMYQTSFLWLHDLSSPDPYYILPAFMILGMLSTLLASVEAKQRLMMIIAAIAFGAVSTVMSAGMVLYLALSALLGIAQTKLLKLFGLNN